MRAGKTLVRDPSKARIAGVCAGIADYFGIEVWLVRILVVSAFFLLAGPFLFFLYVVAWFVLDKKPVSKSHHYSKAEYNSSRGKGWSNPADDEPEKVIVKSTIWQAGESPKRAFLDINRQYDRNEKKLRQLEKYVTSSEFQLNREFRNL
jgi:phage shock protein C